jgi:rRNA pseudouridine-1189 N-methylase Emg1 (Nep1/Mra1 family)
MINEKTTIQSKDVTNEMKVKWLQYFVTHGTADPLFRNVWLETPRNYIRFGEVMNQYLKYKDGRRKNGLTISVQGRKWLDKQSREFP